MIYMTNDDWKKVKYFGPNENWGDWSKIHKVLIFALDELRKNIGKPIHINNAYSISGHSSNSYHYKGMAADIHIKNMSVIDQFIWASRFDVFNGIGVYPNWNNPGLHLDIRPFKDKLSKESRWMGVRINGKQRYVSLNWDNIKKYC